MQIGVMVGGSSRRLGLEDLVTRARDLESRGFPTMWLPNVFGFDAVIASSVIGRETECIELRPSRSRPDRGIACLRDTLSNQDGEPVLTQTVTLMVSRRPYTRELP